MEFYTYTLSNGIRCIHKRVKSSVTYCALTTNVGSRDELESEHGIAHFTEHTLFKGTEHRKAYHINCRLENLGGELNAFTTKEETVIHATTLKGDFAKAAELISDIIFKSTFPQHEVEKEREIIIDEINSYKDSPSERIYDDFEDILFSGSSLGHNILGTKNSVARCDRDNIKSFVERTYNTNQMVFSSIGNFSPKSFERVMNRYFADFSSSSRSFEREKPIAHTPFEKTTNHNTHQAHCMLGNRAYGISDPKRTTLSLLINILGGPSANSLLNISVREKNGLSYNIEAGYTPFSDSGIAAIYFGTDKDKTERCIELVSKQLQKIKDDSLTPRQLSMAKKQFIGQLAISLESNEGYMLGAGKSYLVYNEVDSLDAIYKKILSISREEIREVANEIFTDTSLLIYK